LASAVLGLPLGRRTRRTMVASCVVGLIPTGVYFLALKSAEAQVSRGLLPFWVIWIPDVVVVVVGVGLWFLGSRRT
ncbi:MAG: hypothetical protein LIP77_11585, partial [Planctomycetes bacterium]|nr:hypothetical protein [Planctomycetota bacterium]